jgi:hypothetical protein
MYTYISIYRASLKHTHFECSQFTYKAKNIYNLYVHNSHINRDKTVIFSHLKSQMFLHQQQCIVGNDVQHCQTFFIVASETAVHAISI